MKLFIGDKDESKQYWTVVGDIAVALFLVFVLFLILQHVRSVETILENQELIRRQTEIEVALQKELNPDSADSKVVWIERLAPDRQRLRFSSDVLFRTCRTELKPAGNHILRRVGGVLRQQGIEVGYLESISVEGHTDVRPTGGENCPYTSNWELSTMRATAVVHLLEQEMEIPGKKLSATGQAQYHPITARLDPSSLEKNRRIEVTLQYDRRDVQKQLRVDSLKNEASGSS